VGWQRQCRRMIHVSGFGLKISADAADNKGGLLVARLAEFFSLFLLDFSRESHHQSPIEAQGEPPRRQPPKEAAMDIMAKTLKFINRRFPLDEWKERMRDARKRPQIPAATVAQAVVEMVARRQSSLLEVDQNGRLAEVRSWFGTSRDMVVSDTTLSRSLSGFALEPLREVLWEIAQSMLKREPMRVELASGRKVRIANLDGSQWGDFPGCVLTLVGKRVDIVAGYRMSAGRGHELATSRKLLRDARQRLGKGFVDLLAVDALYMTEKELKWAVDQGGYHLVVKTSDERLSVIQDARGVLFSTGAGRAEGVERIEAVDTDRMVHYGVSAAGGFQWHGLTLKVAHVIERFLKPKRGHPDISQFWVISTDEQLSAQEMRELAHLRWNIENRTFRRLNHLVKSKRRLTKHSHVREALLGLWFIGLNLFGLLLAWIRMGRLNARLKPVKKTWKWFCELFKRATVLAYCSVRSP